MTFRQTIKTHYALSLAVGTFALALAYLAYEYRPVGNYSWTVALLFAAVGVYMIWRARAYYRSVESLKETAPLEMLLTVIPSGGKTRGDTDSWLLLTSAEPAVSPLEKITVHGVDVSVSWLGELPKNKRVVVYGALERHGPVLIELSGEFTWPSSSSAVVRKWRPDSLRNSDTPKRPPASSA